MPEKTSGAGAAANPSISTDGPAGQSLAEEHQLRIARAFRAVVKAKAHLAAAEAELAKLKKGMN